MTRAIIRAVLGLVLAGAAITLAAMLFLAASGAEQPHTWRALIYRASSSMLVIVWLYPWVLTLVVVFGLPAWAILRLGRWTSFLAYSLAGAVAATTALALLFVVWRLPMFGWFEFALWAAVLGSLGGAMFRAVIGPPRQPS